MLAWNGKPLFDAGKFYDVKFVKYITVDPSLHGSVNLSRYSGVQGDIVTAFAVPDQHYTFDSYGITGAELTGSRFTIGNEDIHIQGNFIPKVYSVSYYNDGNGTLAGSLTTATANMTGTLTATPNSHYLFGSYAVTGGSIIGDRLTVTGNCSAKVYFAAEPKYNITLSQQIGGSISADKTTAYSGDIVTLSNTPSAHYDFMNYSLTGAILTGSQFRMSNQNVTARANFSSWPVRNLTLSQQTGGTIGANKTTGYDGDTVSLSNIPSSNYYFNSYSITGATLTGSNFKFNNSNVTAKANFVNTYPSTLYNNATRIGMQGNVSHSSNPAANKLFMDGPYYPQIEPKFIFTYSSTIGSKNYFVLKYDYTRNLNNGQYYWYSTGTSQGVVLRALRGVVSSYHRSFCPEIKDAWLNGLVRDTDLGFSNTFEPMYNQQGQATATDITARLDGSNIFTAYKLPLKTYAKHYNHGRNGTFQTKFSGYRNGQYTLNTTASGKWDYSGFCFEPDAYEDGTWKNIKLVFDMNTFAYSSYMGNELVYKQTNSISYSARGSESKSKLYAIHHLNPSMNAWWYTQWDGTGSAYRNVGIISAKNVSYTYFDNCENANQWAKNN